MGEREWKWGREGYWGIERGRERGFKEREE